MTRLSVLALAVVLMSGCATVTPSPEAPKSVNVWTAKECSDLEGAWERWGCVVLREGSKAYNEIRPALDALQHMPK